MWSILKSVLQLVTHNILMLLLVEYVNNHWTLVSAAAASAGMLLYGVWFLQRPRNFPPGPCGYPIVGCLPFYFRAVGNKFNKYKDKYGDIFSIWLGGNSYVVILHSYEAIKEVYINSGSIFVARDPETMTNVSGVADTIFNANYDECCKESRKTAAQCLRTAIRTKLLNILGEELTEMETYLDCHLGEPIDVLQNMRRIFTNTTTQVLFSKRCNDEDSDMLSDKLWSKNIYFVEVIASLLMPRYISTILFAKSLKLGRRLSKDVMNYVRENVRHRMSLPENGSLQDVLDVYLQRGRYTEDQIVATLFQLMPDSSFTSPIMTMWVLLYLVNHPECQADISDEIHKAFQNGIDLNLRSQMPVTESFIMEVFRVVTPISFTIPNRPMKTTTVRGYEIPDYVSVIAHIEAVHQDPDLFPEPEKFKPRRFIKDGEICNKQGFMPFGLGTRMCIGEQLTRSTIFYIITRLVLQYKIYSPDGAPLSIECDNKFPFIKLPKKFSLCLKKK